jgi:hypothetical protein
MNTLNLEAQKASLAHEILAITDERAINNIRSFLKSHTFHVKRFKGILTEEEAAQYHRHLQTARSEWNRDI